MDKTKISPNTPVQNPDFLTCLCSQIKMILLSMPCGRKQYLEEWLLTKGEHSREELWGFKILEILIILLFFLLCVHEKLFSNGNLNGRI